MFPSKFILKQFDKTTGERNHRSERNTDVTNLNGASFEICIQTFKESSINGQFFGFNHNLVVHVYYKISVFPISVFVFLLKILPR